MQYHLTLDNITSYTHTIDASGGYASASIGMRLSQVEIEEWLENGLGRQVEINNDGGVLCWEGYVNDMEARIGGLTVKRGPLMDVTNRVSVIYTPEDTTVDPPVLGTRTRTAYANDADSQSRYGIIEKVLSNGNTTATNAAYNRDTYLAEHAEAETTPTQLTVGSSGELTLTLNCRGYIDYLKAYTYNNATTGVTTISASIQAVLAADPNTIFSTDYSRITTNALSIPSYIDDDPMAYDHIMGLCAIGDMAANRYNFGIYGARRAEYAVIPSTVAYIWRINEDGEIRTPLGNIVRPWDVLPARWAYIPDFMIGRISGAIMRNDPRYMFIESVTYSAPYGLAMTGAKVTKLPQVLATWGLMGLSR